MSLLPIKSEFVCSPHPNDSKVGSGESVNQKFHQGSLSPIHQYQLITGYNYLRENLSFENCSKTAQIPFIQILKKQQILLPNQL